MTLDPNLLIFYVSSVEKSMRFYTELLEIQPIHSEPTYVMYLLKTGFRFGLWVHSAVEPPSRIMGGGAELTIQVDSDHRLDELFTRSRQRDFKIIQTPTHMDFGYTFALCDNDDHRVRFFSKK